MRSNAIARQVAVLSYIARGGCMRSAGLCVWSWVIAIVITCSTWGVSAQAPESPNRGRSTDDVARGLFEAGRASYGMGEFERALDFFQQAYDLSQRPALLYNIGQASDRLHRDALTVQAFHEYLRLMPESEHRTEVESRLRALERLLEAEQHEAARVEPTPLDEPGLTSAPIAMREHGATDNAGSTLAPWLVTGLGVAVVATGGVLAVVGHQRIANVEDAPDNAPWSRYESDASSGPALATTGFVLLGVGAAVTLTGVFWLVLGGASDDGGAVALGIQPGGLRLAGTL